MRGCCGELMKAILFFRIVCILEALSYVALMAYAMPMKYMFGNPTPVTMLGRAHGGLVFLFLFALLIAMIVGKWSIKTAFLLFLASLVPVVPFFLDPWLSREQKRVVKAVS